MHIYGLENLDFLETLRIFRFFFGGVAELADATDLKSVEDYSCGFESRRPYHHKEEYMKGRYKNPKMPSGTSLPRPKIVQGLLHDDIRKNPEFKRRERLVLRDLEWQVGEYAEEWAYPKIELDVLKNGVVLYHIKCNGEDGNHSLELKNHNFPYCFSQTLKNGYQFRMGSRYHDYITFSVATFCNPEDVQRWLFSVAKLQWVAGWYHTTFSIQEDKNAFFFTMARRRYIISN